MDPNSALREIAVLPPGLETLESCELCGAPLTEGVPVPGLEFLNLIRCAQCTLAITSPRPRTENINDVYPPDYYAHIITSMSLRQKVVDRLRTYKSHYPGDDFGLSRLFWWTGARVFGSLFLFDLPFVGLGRRLLDIGCGTGDTLLWAKEHGWEVYGLELDGPAAARAHERGLIEVQCGTLETTRYPDEFFDAITMLQVLEHLPSPRYALQECHRILKPDGYLVVAVPNFQSYPRRLLCDFWHALQIPHHLFHFTEPTLKRLAEECGFTVSKLTWSPAIVVLILNLLSVWNKLSGLARNAPRLARNIFVWESGLRISDVMSLRMVKAATFGFAPGGRNVPPDVLT